MNDTLNEKNRWHCEICKHTFKRRLGYENHLLSNKHKARINEKTDTTYELKRENEELKLTIQKLNNELDNLKTQMSKTQKKNSYSGNHYENCVINNVNNIQLNITLNPHGNENWDYLQNDIMNIMKGVNTCIPILVQKLHFDKDHPENHNVKLPNKRFSDMQFYDGSKWRTLHKKDVIENMITHIVDTLDEKYGDDFRKASTQFITKLWDEKTNLIISEQTIDRNLRKQVEFSIIDGQNMLKKSNS